MTIDEIIEELEESKDYPASDPASDEALDGAIDIMRKYQQIVQIYQKWNGINDFSYKNAMQRIGEVIEDDSSNLDNSSL